MLFELFKHSGVPLQGSPFPFLKGTPGIPRRLFRGGALRHHQPQAPGGGAESEPSAAAPRAAEAGRGGLEGFGKAWSLEKIQSSCHKGEAVLTLWY